MSEQTVSTAVRRTAARAAKPRTPEQLATDAENVALWFEFKSEQDPTRRKAKRDVLMVRYAPLVKVVASRVGSGLPPNIERDDLTSYGMFGLIDAIEKFEPERGFKFETYAIQRIKGTIIDELRAVDWVPRSVRTKIRDIEKAFVSLETELGRTPTDVEVATKLDLTVAELQRIYSQVSNTNVVALDDLMHRGGDGDDSSATLGDRLTDDRVEMPGHAVEVDEQKVALSHAVQSLPERDRIVITLYYFENLTLAEIGQVLGVTESRVCQLHTKATVALKTKLATAA